MREGRHFKSARLLPLTSSNVWFHMPTMKVVRGYTHFYYAPTSSLRPNSSSTIL